MRIVLLTSIHNVFFDCFAFALPCLALLSVSLSFLSFLSFFSSIKDDLGGNLNVIDRARDEDEERGRGRSKTQQNGKYAPTTAVQYNTFPKKAPAPVVAGADKGGDKLADPAADSDDSQDSDPPARRPPLASGAPRRSKSSDAGVAVSSRRSSSVPAANSTSFKAATAPVEQSKMVRKILAAQIKRKQLMSDPTRAAQIAILKGIPPEVGRYSDEALLS